MPDDLLTRTEEFLRIVSVTGRGMGTLSDLCDAVGLLKEWLILDKRRQAGHGPWEESSMGGPQRFRRGDEGGE